MRCFAPVSGWTVKPPIKLGELQPLLWEDNQVEFGGPGRYVTGTKNGLQLSVAEMRSGGPWTWCIERDCGWTFGSMVTVRDDFDSAEEAADDLFCFLAFDMADAHNELNGIGAEKKKVGFMAFMLNLLSTIFPVCGRRS